MNRPKHRASGAEALFAAAFTYALTGILVREVAPMWGNNAQAAARFALVLLFLLVYSRLRHDKAHVPRRQLPAAIAMAVLFVGVVLFFTNAIEKTTVANVLFTYYAANMIVSFLFGSLFLHEKVTADKILAIALALAGLSVYSHALLAGSLGLIYGVAAGVCDGSANVFRKRLAGVDRNATLLVQYGVGAVLTWLVTFLSGQPIIRHVSLRASLITLVFAGVLIVGSNLLLYGFQHFDINLGTVIMSTELIFASVMAYLLFHEKPTGHELVGGALIFVGSIVSSGVLNNLKPKNSAALDDRAV